METRPDPGASSPAASAIDIDAYLQRIGYQGPLAPDLATLAAIIRHHAAAITFEALDVMLGHGVCLERHSIVDKLVRRRRGGYCFEQNGLLRQALEALGFHVEGLLGRVLWMRQPHEIPSELTHMALRVDIAGVPWLADVGFGSCTPTAPLRLDTETPQATDHEQFRLLRSDMGHLLQARIEDRWEPVYELSDQARTMREFVAANRITAEAPDSHFRQRLMVARTTPEARMLLLFNRLSLRRPDGGLERHHLSASELQEVLVELFHLPFEPAWRPILEQAADTRWED